MAMYTVALDLSKYKHTATILSACPNSPLQTVTFAVSREGFQRFDQVLQQYSTTPTEFVIGCEATGRYGETILRHLQGQGYPIVRMNPAQVAQFRRGLGRRAKTDAVDADAMAKQLTVTNWVVEPVPHETAIHLQRVTRLRLSCTEEQGRWVNRLRGILNQMCPELERLLPPIASPTTLAILGAYPSRLQLMHADLPTLTTLLERVSRRTKGATYAQQLQAVAATSVGLDDCWLEAELRVVLDQVIRLNRTIADLDRSIQTLTQQLLREYSQALQITPALTIAAFPCGSYLTLGTLLAELGDLRRFASVKQLMSYLGWCPQTQESGTWSITHPPMSHRGNRFARRVLWLLAIVAVRCVPEYRTYFRDRVAAGKNKMKSLVAVGRKLLSAIYAILRTGQPYDPSRYTHHPTMDT